MNKLRAFLILVAICVIAICLSFSGRDNAGAACARCGDGVCARSCENATSCPRDCGGTTSVASEETP